jgi:beta-lactam-binding protein with PASTA domain
VLVEPRLYVGRPAKQAQRALRRLGLTVEVQLVTTGVRRETAGVVVAVRPSGRVPAGSTVLLVVRA